MDTAAAHGTGTGVGGPVMEVWEERWVWPRATGKSHPLSYPLTWKRTLARRQFAQIQSSSNLALCYTHPQKTRLDQSEARKVRG